MLLLFDESGGPDLSGTGSISQSQTVTATGSKQAASTGSFSQTNTVTGSGVAARFGVGSFSQTQNTTASGTSARSSAGAISQTHSLTLTAGGDRFGVGSMSQTSSVAGDGLGGRLGTGSISQTHTMDASGTGVLELDGTGSITQTHTMSASGVLGYDGTGSISQSHSMAASGTSNRNGVAALSQTHSAVASGTSTRSSAGGTITQEHYMIQHNAQKRVQVNILYDGIDITDICVLRETEFVTRANGQAGDARIGIKDTALDWDLPAGKTLELYLDGRREWDGWVVDRRQAYWFEGTQDFKPRHLTLIGADRNLLFQRRVLYNKVDPALAVDNDYPAGTRDRAVILNSVNRFLGTTDGIDYSTKVEDVAAVDPYQAFQVAGPSRYLGDLFRDLARDVGTVFYIDPDRYLVYTDVNEPSAPFGISDRPVSSGGSVSVTDDFVRTVSGSWGSGSLGPWTNYFVSGGITLSVNGSAAVSTGQGVADLEVAIPVEAQSADTIRWHQKVTWASSFDGSQRIEMGFHDEDFNFEVAADVTPAGNLGIWAYDATDYFEHYDDLAVEPNPSDTVHMEMEVNRTTGVMRCRYWLDGEATPDWMRSITFPGFVDAPLTLAMIGRFVSSGSKVYSHDFVTLEYGGGGGGGTEVGAREITLLRDASQMVNDAMIWGAGLGADTIRFSRVQDAASIAAHGRWQNRDGFRSSVWKQESVDRIADSIVYGSPASKRGHKDEAVSVTCALFEPGLRVIHKVPVRLDIWDYEDVLPVREMRLTFPTPDAVRYDVTLSHEIDAPWSIIDPWRPRDREETCEPVTCQISGLPDGACVDDTFQGTTSAGAGWGTADTGQVWGVSGGNSTTNVTSNGNARLLAVGGSGSTTAALSAISSISPACAPEGTDGTILARFTCNSPTAWTSTHAFSQAATLLGEPYEGVYHAPGVRIDPEEPNNNLQAGVGRHYLQINSSGAAFGSYVRIYNAAGQLWVASKSQNTAFQQLPQAVGPASENFWVKMRVTSNGQLLAKVWDNSDPEPDGWLISDAFQDWSGDVIVAAVFNTNSAANSAYEIRCHEFHISTLGYTGAETVSTEGGDGLVYECIPVRPCGPVSVAPILDHCEIGTGALIDDLERAIGLGRTTGQWGTASNGDDWSAHFNLDPGSVGGGGVSGSYGYLRFEPFAGDNDAWANLDATLASGDFDLTAEFSFYTSSDLSGSSDSLTIDLGIGPISGSGAGGDALVRLFMDAVTPSNGSVRLIDDGNVTDAFTIAYNTPYKVRWERNLAGGISRVKVWNAGSAEPSTWTLEDAPWSGADADRLSFYAQAGPNDVPSGDIIEARLHEIAESGSASVCYYRTTVPFQTGTARLYMNGLLLRKGVDWEEYDPARGTIKVYIEVTGPLYLDFEGVGHGRVLLPDTAIGGLFTLPVSGGTVSGTFGPQVSGWSPAVWHGTYYPHFHNGVDFAVSTGTAVYAAAGGYVSHEDQAAGGTMIHIFHPNGMRTTYAHLSSRVTTVGSTVNQGDLIGYSGDSGNVTGPHLHWGMVFNGSPEDPTDYL